jgi:hypothetical protein
MSFHTVLSAAFAKVETRLLEVATDDIGNLAAARVIVAAAYQHLDAEARQGREFENVDAAAAALLAAVRAGCAAAVAEQVAADAAAEALAPYREAVESRFRDLLFALRDRRNPRAARAHLGELWLRLAQLARQGRLPALESQDDRVRWMSGVARNIVREFRRSERIAGLPRTPRGAPAADEGDLDDRLEAARALRMITPWLPQLATYAEREEMAGYGAREAVRNEERQRAFRARRAAERHLRRHGIDLGTLLGRQFPRPKKK